MRRNPSPRLPKRVKRLHSVRSSRVKSLPLSSGFPNTRERWMSLPKFTRKMVSLGGIRYVALIENGLKPLLTGFTSLHFVGYGRANHQSSPISSFAVHVQRPVRNLRPYHYDRLEELDDKVCCSLNTHTCAHCCIPLDNVFVSPSCKAHTHFCR